LEQQSAKRTEQGQVGKIWRKPSLGLEYLLRLLTTL
jgi:hypothetical protein